MSIYLLNGTIAIPYAPDIVYIDDKAHEAHGQRGVITKSREGQVFVYDCEYLHTVKLDRGDVVHVNDQQVSFKQPTPKRRKPRLT